MHAIKIANSGCDLFKYVKACHAEVRLPDGSRVAISVDANTIAMRRTRGFFDLLLNAKPIGTWNLGRIVDGYGDKARLPGHTVQAVVLDILIERVCRCQTLHDVRVKASTGALNPFEDAERRFEVLAKQAARADSQPGLP